MTKQQLIKVIQDLPDRLIPELESFVVALQLRSRENTSQSLERGINYVSDEEQAELEAGFGSPAYYEDDEVIDMTDWVRYGNQVS